MGISANFVIYCLNKRINKTDVQGRVSEMRDLIKERLQGEVLDVIIEHDREKRPKIHRVLENSGRFTIMASHRDEIFMKDVAVSIRDKMVPCVLYREAMHLRDKPNAYGNYLGSPLVMAALNTFRSLEGYINGISSAEKIKDDNYEARKNSASFALSIWPEIRDCIEEKGCKTQEEIASCLRDKEMFSERGCVIQQSQVSRYLRRVSEFGSEEDRDAVEAFMISSKASV